MPKKIKVAIVGVGNCASSLIQSVHKYKSEDMTKNHGLITPVIPRDDGGFYNLEDIEFVAAYDVNTDKVGLRLCDAIWVAPNCTTSFSAPVESIAVEPGPLLDGLSPRMAARIPNNGRVLNADLLHLYQWDELEKLAPVKEWLKVICTSVKNSGADILISYLPVGSYHASRFWATVCLRTGVSFINAMPEFICSESDWSIKFLNEGIPCAGDDIKSQVGATILHRMLVDLVDRRGLTIKNTYQLNIGGNTDFENMLDQDRLVNKRISKTRAVTSAAEQHFDTKIGPSDYIPHLNDKKICYIELIGEHLGGHPFTIDIKLSVEDSPNSAGCMIDIIRLMALARDRKEAGYQGFSSYYFKHPAIQYSESINAQIVEDFISNE